jgi:hypothetical protein
MHRFKHLLSVSVFALATVALGANAVHAQTAGPDQVALSVNVLSGEVRLIGNSADAAELYSYQIDSAAGSLDSFNWDSLADQGVGDFVEFTQSDSSVFERAFNDTASINAAGLSLGSLFRVGTQQDLVFSYGEEDNGGVVGNFNGSVTYVPEPATASMLVALAGVSTLRRRRHR